MTLKYMQGFDTSRDDSDVRLQGIIASPVKMQVALSPSFTNLAGTSLHTMGPHGTADVAHGASAARSPGYYNSGITLGQAIAAGGFTFGFNAKFNSGVSQAIGPGNGSNNSAIAFDGTLYWAIRQQTSPTSAFAICTSPDLMNWTPVSSQPAAAVALSNLYYMGNGTMLFVPGSNPAGGAGTLVFFSNNNGASWTSQTIPGIQGAGASPAFGVTGFATGNPSFPHLFVQQTTASSFTTPSSIAVGTLGGTMTSIGSVAVGNVNASTARGKIFNGLIVCPMSTTVSGGQSGIASAMANSANLNIPIGIANTPWTLATWTTSIGNLFDIQFLPSANLYVVATSTGIWTTPNPGSTAGVAGQWAQGATVVWTQRYSTTAMNTLYIQGSELIAFGNAGHIITSTNAITWTEAGAHILPVGVAGNNWASSWFDGNRYVLFSDVTTGVVATTPDGLTNYSVQYVQDAPENASSNLTGFGNVGLEVGTVPAANGTFTGNNGFLFQPAAASGGNRVITIVGPGGSFGTFTVPTTPLSHFYELHFIYTGSGNVFNVQIFLDSVQVITASSVNFNVSASSNVLILCLDRLGAFTGYDDIYITLDDKISGTLQGPLGIVNILAERPTTDVQAQFTKIGSAASNALSVNTPALSSNSPNALQSTNVGDKDIYSTTDTIPAGFTPLAVQYEGYFTKVSSTAPTVSIGVRSNGQEADGAQVTIQGGPTYVTGLFERDPNGNIAWTRNSLAASDFVLNHVS